MARFFTANHYDIIVAVTIMVSVIIVVIGFCKALWFDRIRNKEIRRVVLALTNVAACYVSALGYFLREGWDFKYYPIAGFALTLASIFTYYVYETVPKLRPFISGIGKAALGKVFHIGLVAATTEDPNTVKAAVATASAELKSYTKTEIKNATKKVKVDKDLIGL